MNFSLFEIYEFNLTFIKIMCYEIMINHYSASNMTLAPGLFALKKMFLETELPLVAFAGMPVRFVSCPLAESSWALTII